MKNLILFVICLWAGGAFGIVNPGQNSQQDQILERLNRVENAVINILKEYLETEEVDSSKEGLRIAAEELIGKSSYHPVWSTGTEAEMQAFVDNFIWDREELKEESLPHNLEHGFKLIVDLEEQLKMLELYMKRDREDYKANISKKTQIAARLNRVENTIISILKEYLQAEEVDSSKEGLRTVAEELIGRLEPPRPVWSTGTEAEMQAFVHNFIKFREEFKEQEESFPLFNLDHDLKKLVNLEEDLQLLVHNRKRAKEDYETKISPSYQAQILERLNKVEAEIISTLKQHSYTEEAASSKDSLRTAVELTGNLDDHPYLNSDTKYEMKKFVNDLISFKKEFEEELKIIEKEDILSLERDLDRLIVSIAEDYDDHKVQKEFDERVVSVKNGVVIVWKFAADLFKKYL